MTGRVHRQLVDLARAAPDAVEQADIVVLHRVVCCYPDYERLLSAAADHARTRLVFSFPPRNAMSRAIVAARIACSGSAAGSSARSRTRRPRCCRC